MDEAGADAEGAPEDGGNLWWFAMYRGSGREPSDMVVAWLTEDVMYKEMGRYARWDMGATKNSRWEIERFPRQHRASYFREQCRYGDDLLEYHYVLDDRARSASHVEVLRAISESEIV